MKEILEEEQLKEKIQSLHSKIINLGRNGVPSEIVSRVEILLQVCRSTLNKMQTVNATRYVSEVEEMIQKIEEKNKNQLEKNEQSQVHNS